MKNLTDAFRYAWAESSEGFVLFAVVMVIGYSLVAAVVIEVAINWLRG